jgi:hypothetical protein
LQRKLLDDAGKGCPHIAERTRNLLDHLDQFVAGERTRRIELSDAFVDHVLLEGPELAGFGQPALAEFGKEVSWQLIVIVEVARHQDQAELIAVFEKALDLPSGSTEAKFAVDELLDRNAERPERSAAEVRRGPDRLHADRSTLVDSDTAGVVDDRDVVLPGLDGEQGRLPEHVVDRPEHQGVEVQHGELD